MVALTADRPTPRRDGDFVELPVAAGYRIYAGAMVAINSSGFATPAHQSGAQYTAGVAQHAVNSNGSTNGALTVRVCRLPHQFANATSYRITRADIGFTCYVSDDQTVGKSGAGSVRAGRVVDVDDGGVWVDFRTTN